jgi:outer membrane lipoprotein-sorting protein
MADVRRSRPSLALSLAAVATLLAAGIAAAAPAWNVDELMQRLAQRAGGHATFVERKYLAVLDRPVESSGELSFTPPARLEKRTLKPKPELLLLDGDSVTVEREGKRHTLSLSQYPQVAALVDSVRATLAGDGAALRRSYRVELDGTPAHWFLTLFPSDTQMAAVVLRVRISGGGDRLHSIEIRQADGDHSLMTIEETERR